MSPESEVQILLASDRPEGVEGLATALDAVGTVVVAYSAAETVQRAADAVFVVIVLDVQGGPADALDVATLIRHGEGRSHEAPIVVLVDADPGDAFWQRTEQLGGVEIASRLSAAMLRASVSVLAQLFVSRESLREELARVRQLSETRELAEQSEQKYRRMVETAQEGIWVLDEGLRTTFVNQRMAGMLGYTEGEMVGRLLSDLVPEMAQVPVQAQLERHVPPFRSQQDLVLRRKDGSTLWVLVSASPIVDNGQFAGVLTMVTDINDRVQVERERDEHRRMLQTLLDTLPDVIVFKDRDSVYRAYNEPLARLMGCSREELIGKSDAELYPPEEAQRYRQEDVRVMETGQPLTAEHLMDTAVGQRLLEAVKVPLRDESGEVIGLLTAARDITERKRVEEREATQRRQAEARAGAAEILQEHRPLPERVADTLGLVSGPEDDIGVLVLTRDGQQLRKLAARGRSWARCHGAAVRECAIGGAMAGGERLISGDLPAAEGSHKCRVLAATRPTRYILPLSHAGETLGVLCVLVAGPFPVLPAAKIELLRQVGELLGLAIANERLQDEVQRARLTAEEASLSKSAFLASMSHELRTPLNTVLGLAESLQEGVYGQLNERQLSSLRNIEEGGRHLLSLITDILDFSKVEAGQFELEIGPVSVAEVCGGSLRLVKGLADKKGVQIELEIEAPSAVLKADGRRLMQVLVNLLSNAVKFTPGNGRTGLKVTPDLAGRTMRFAVWDTGIGIEKKDFARLFQPFVQLDATLSRQSPGTGLGLSLVRRMVEMHGGRVEVESDPGRGSRFTAVLPWDPPA